MRWFLLLALVAPAVSAQAPADTLDASPRPAARVWLYVGGVTGSYFVTAIAADLLPRVLGERGEAAALVGIPTGAVLGVASAARMAGLPGSMPGAVRGAARGTLVATVVVPLAFAAVGQRFPFQMTEREAFLFGAALTAAAVLPTAYAVRGYTAVPVRVRAPEGGSAPGVAVRVAL